MEQYRRIDDLEKRMDDHSTRLRRRILNLLDTAPSHRLSHLRLFVSHHDRSNESDALVAAHEAPKDSNGPTTQQQQKQQVVVEEEERSRKWTLVIEGKLLIDHLDHHSAKMFDDRLKKEFMRRHGVSEDHSSLAIATSQNTTNTQPSEIEERLEPMNFTHFFDKLVVQFQSVYHPIDEKAMSGNAASATGATSSFGAAAAAPSTPKGGSGSKKKRGSISKRQSTPEPVVPEEPAFVDPKLCTWSDPEEFTWNKTITTITSATPAEGKTPAKPAGISTSTTTPDAHAFFVHYESPPPPPPSSSSGLQLYGAIATAQLYPTRGPEQRYKPSREFAKTFFPKHVTVLPSPVLPTASIAEAKKADEMQNENNKDSSGYKRKASTTPAHQTGPHALEPEIHVPTSLSMLEILTSLYTYIQDHKLTADDDPTMIQNDKTLESLFKCEKMRFHELQTLLMQAQLIHLLPKPAPIVLKYVIKADQPAPAMASLDDESTSSAAAADGAVAPMTMDLHNDVHVPNLFPSRAREILRRIKHRELDYTGSRTKARYLLMAGRAMDENVVKTKIEQAIVGAHMEPEDWPVHAALAKAANPHSEARAVAQLDAKTCFLLEQVERSQQAAQQAWDLVEWCRDLGTAPDDSTSTVVVDNNNKKSERNEDDTTTMETESDPMNIDTPEKANSLARSTTNDLQEANI